MANQSRWAALFVLMLFFISTGAAWADMAGETRDLLTRFETYYTPGYVIAAGLVDGINPCAFATLVFFISFLRFAGKSRRETLLIGIIFTLTVFVTYFIFMFGVAIALHALDFYEVVSKVISIAAAALAFVVGVLSVRDAVVYGRTGDARGVKVQLPSTLKKKIHAVIRERLKGGHLVLGAVVIGFLVTVFETACSGQMAFPTIVRIIQEPDVPGFSWRLRAVVYLVVYNLCFVLPLIVVFLLVFFGMGSERLAEWSRRHLALTKILMAVVFFWLGLAIVLSGF